MLLFCVHELSVSSRKANNVSSPMLVFWAPAGCPRSIPLRLSLKMSKLNLGTVSGKAKGDMWIAEGGEALESIPGMGPDTVAALNEKGVTTTAQLTGIALSFFAAGTTARVRDVSVGPGGVRTVDPSPAPFFAFLCGTCTAAKYYMPSAAPCSPTAPFLLPPFVLQQRAQAFYDWLAANVPPLKAYRSAVVRCIFERLQRNGFPDLMEGIAEGDEDGADEE